MHRRLCDGDDGALEWLLTEREMRLRDRRYGDCGGFGAPQARRNRCDRLAGHDGEHGYDGDDAIVRWPR